MLYGVLFLRNVKPEVIAVMLSKSYVLLEPLQVHRDASSLKEVTICWLLLFPYRDHDLHL